MISGLATVVSVLLGGTFAWSGISKATRPGRWRLDLQTYKLPRLIKALAFLGLPWAELAVAAVLVLGERWGAEVALGLTCLFCVAIIRARLMQKSNKLNCGCFGGRRFQDYRLLLLRNVLIVGFAGFIIWGAGSGSNLGESLGDRAPFLLPVLLLLVAGVSAMW